MSISTFLKSLQIDFNNLALYESAFTHSSYAAENKGALDYENLEFLGDSLLGFIVAEYLYKNWKDLDINFLPADLSKHKAFLVSNENLSNAAKSLQLHNFIRVSKNIQNPQTNIKIMASVLEALISAIYFDQDLKVLKAFIIKNIILPFFPSKNKVFDFRYELNKIAQEKKQNKPVYSHQDKNDKNNLVICRYLDYETVGESPTKKEAIQKASQAMWFLLKKNIPNT